MDYDDLLIERPEDFQYRPACGSVLNGVVTVSGIQLTQHTIDTKGRALTKLVGICRRIDERIEKESGMSLFAKKYAT